MAVSARQRAAFSMCKLLANVDPDTLILTQMKFEPGATVPHILAGEAAIGLVVSGRIQVRSTGIDGQQVVLNTHQRGDCFGIASIFTGDPLGTVLVAETATEVLFISRRQFLELLQKEPTLARDFGYLLNKKIAFLTEKIEFLSLPSGRSKLASYLLAHSDETGTVHLNGSKENLAATLGISRATLFRELSHLEREGLIETQRTKIQICSPAEMRRICLGEFEDKEIDGGDKK